jgi:hypothetical protein
VNINSPYVVQRTSVQPETLHRLPISEDARFTPITPTLIPSLIFTLSEEKGQDFTSHQCLSTLLISCEPKIILLSPLSSLLKFMPVLISSTACFLFALVAFYLAFSTFLLLSVLLSFLRVSYCGTLKPSLDCRLGCVSILSKSSNFRNILVRATPIISP